MRKFAETELGYPIERLEFHGWTQTFSSTAGPSGGIGGQAMTPFDVICFLDQISHRGVMFCSDEYKVKQCRPSEPLRW